MTPRPFPHINRRLGATPLITLVSFLSASSCLFSFRRFARHSREQRPNECNNKVILVFHLFTDGAGVASRRSASPNLFPSSDYANGISALLAAAARSPAPLDEAPALRISVTDRRNRSENPSAHRTRHTTGFRTCHPLLSRFTSQKKNVFSFESIPAGRLNFLLRSRFFSRQFTCFRTSGGSSTDPAPVKRRLRGVMRYRQSFTASGEAEIV